MIYCICFMVILHSLTHAHFGAVKIGPIYFRAGQRTRQPNLLLDFFLVILWYIIFCRALVLLVGQ